MYLPSSFAETNRDKLYDLIESYSFAILCSNHDGRPMATHLPLLLDRTGEGALVGHFARANPQWRDMGEQTVLAIFSGPHAYISPSWYGAEEVVPTWNYVAVHVEGKLEPVNDLASTIETVHRMTACYEGAGHSPGQGPWSFDPSAEHIAKMAQQIVAFRIPIARIEGKWKLSQNHPRERQENVAKMLWQRADENSRDVASLMHERLKDG